jgi:hypothetical protein
MKNKIKIFFIAIICVGFIFSANISQATFTSGNPGTAPKLNGSGSGPAAPFDFAAFITAISKSVTQMMNLLAAYETQLQAIISKLPAGTSTTAMQASLADYTAKIADCQKQVSSLLSNTSKLTPFTPGGNTNLWMLTNIKYLIPIQAEISAALTDLQAAYNDATSIHGKMVLMHKSAPALPSFK